MANNAMLQQLCEQFIKRSAEMGYKGKKRDDMAIEFFVGAANVLAIQPTKQSVQDFSAVSAMIGMDLRYRGYYSVETYAKKE